MTEYRSTFAKLDEDNYSAWAGKMRSLFMVKQLWATVTGEGDDDMALDEQALGLIGLNVEDHHMKTVLESSTACEAWTAFQDMYKAASHARRMQLKAELHDLQINSGESVAKYASRVTVLRDHLVAAGSTVDEDDLVLSMLGGLTIDFKTVVTIIRSSDKELKLRDVLPKLLQEEQLVNRSDKSSRTAPPLSTPSVASKAAVVATMEATTSHPRWSAGFATSAATSSATASAGLPARLHRTAPGQSQQSPFEALR